MLSGRMIFAQPFCKVYLLSCTSQEVLRRVDQGSGDINGRFILSSAVFADAN